MSFVKNLRNEVTAEVHDWLLRHLEDVGSPVKKIELKAKTVRITTVPKSGSVSLSYDEFEQLLNYTEDERDALILQVLGTEHVNPQAAYLTSFLHQDKLPLLLKFVHIPYWMALRTILWHSVKRNRPITNLTNTLYDNLKAVWEANETEPFNVSDYERLDYCGGWRTPSGAVFAAFELLAYPAVYENLMRCDYTWLANAAIDTLKPDQLSYLTGCSSSLRLAIEAVQKPTTPKPVEEKQNLAAALSAAVDEQQHAMKHAQNIADRLSALEKQVAELRKLVVSPVRLRLHRLHDNPVVRGELTVLGQKVGVE